MDHTLKGVKAEWRRAGKWVITSSLQVLKWKTIGGAEGTNEVVWKNTDQSVGERKGSSRTQSRGSASGRDQETCVQRHRNGKWHCGLCGYKELGIAPTLGYLYYGQDLNINNAMIYNLQNITFPYFGVFLCLDTQKWNCWIKIEEHADLRCLAKMLSKRTISFHSNPSSVWVN